MADPEKQLDAGARFSSRVQNSNSPTEWVNAHTDFIKSAVTQFRESKAPFTNLLIVITCLVFGLQSALYLIVVEDPVVGVLAILYDGYVFVGLTGYYFLNYPWIAWPLSEFLHRGIGHFIANITFLAVLGRILEPRFERRHYILWFFVVVLVATPIHAFIGLVTSPKPHVAVYGISDYVYSLAFFSLPYLAGMEYRTELEYFGGAVGVASAFLVLYHLLQAVVTMSIAPVNPGHFVGGVLGVGIYLYYSRMA